MAGATGAKAEGGGAAGGVHFPLTVPLVSFEGICGEAIAPVTGRSRIVVLHCLGAELEGGYFALVSQGFPQVLRVTTDVVRPDNSRAIPERCQLA